MPPAKTAGELLEQFLEREADLVGQEEDAGEDGEENRDAEDGSGQDVVDPVGHDDLAHPEPGDAGAGDLFDPVVAAADDGMEGILVGDQQRTDLLPDRDRENPFHHRRDFRVSLHQFGGHPRRRVGSRNRITNPFRQLQEDIAVVWRNLGEPRPVDRFSAGNGDDPLHEFPDAAVFRSDHRDNRDSEDLFQRSGVDPDPLFLRHVQHVECHDHRRAEEEKFREEVKASLQGGRIRQQDDDVGRFMDDEFPGNPLLFREGRQTVCSGEIDDPHLHAVRRVGALFLLDGFSGPIADVL